MTLLKNETNDHMVCVDDIFVNKPTLQTMSIFNAIKRAVPECTINIKDISEINSKFNFEVLENNTSERVLFETYTSSPFCFA